MSAYDIGPGGLLPSISCPVATSLAADAFAFQKLGELAKGKTLLWAWMSRGFLSPKLAAEWLFNGDEEELQEHMQRVKGSYRDLLGMRDIPSLDKRHLTCKDEFSNMLTSWVLQYIDC